MKRLIVNADDFGLSKGIDQGIIEAFKYGTITSASLMANMPAFEDACSLAKENSGLGTGVHLNLLRGKPLLSPTSIPTLMGRNGYFVGNISVFVKRLFLREFNLLEIEKELRAQIERVLTAGIKITHFDSEKHLHCYPRILRIVVKLARDYEINKIRYINERILLPYGENRLSWMIKNIKNKQYYKSKILNYMCKQSKNYLDENRISYPDYFYGIMYAGRITKVNYKSILESVSDGISEFVCHPGCIDSELSASSKQLGSFYINAYREEELKVLLDSHLPQQIKQLGIKLVSYAEV